MIIVVDTSAYSAFNRRDVRLAKWFGGKHQLLIPLIVVGELRAGFAYGNREKENNSLLTRFLSVPNVQTLTLTDDTAKHYAGIYYQLKRAGKPIGTNDIWIAALCIENSVPLLTLDSDFSRIKSLKLINLD